MSSTVKAIIAGAAVLVLLGGALLALKLTEPKPEPEPLAVVEDDSSLTLYNADFNNIVSVAVTNENGGYTIARTQKIVKPETSESVSGDKANTDIATEASKFTVSELNGVKIDNSILDTLPSNAATLKATKLIEENAADLNKYGLQSPKAEVTLTFDGEDSGAVTLLVGDETPSGDAYAMLKDKNTVYAVSKSLMDVYTYEKEYFVSRVCIDKPAEDDYPIVESVTVHRKDLDNDIKFQYDPLSDSEDESGGTVATHVMTSPVSAYLDVTDSVKYTHGMFGITASSVLSLSPSAEELEFSGINDPTCTVTTVLDNGKTYTLKIGIQFGADSEEETGYIGYIDGIDILWKFSPESIPWVTMKAEDAMSSLLFGDYIYDVSAMTIVTDESTLAFTGAGDSEDNYSVTLNGKAFDIERYKKFYQALIKAPAEEICMSDEGIGKRVAAFIISHNNGKPDDTIEMFESEDKKIIIKKNGVISFKCRSSFVTKSLLPNIQNINGTEEFVTNW